MPTLKCVCCGKTSEEHKMISCCACKDDYFHSCADLTATEVKSIRAKKSLSWNCPRCAELGNNIQELKSLIISLQKEIENIKSIKLSAPVSPNTTLDFEEVIQEISERNSRKKNIILYGVPENISGNRDEKVIHDQQQITNVLNHLLPEAEFESTPKPMRLGKLDVNKSTPRPIKITLPSESIAHELIHKAHRLKTFNDIPNVKVSLDKTPRQQEHYRNLKKELERRITAGENNLRIKYIRGSPQIVPVN